MNTPPALTREGETLLYKGIPVSEMAAFPVVVAAALVGLSKSKFYELISEGRIRKTPEGLVRRRDLENMKLE